jgi:hypothetical protein
MFFYQRIGHFVDKRFVYRSGFFCRLFLTGHGITVVSTLPD